jgi:hypothetical protein
MRFIPFIHSVVKKKENRPEQLPLFVELPPIEPVRKSNESDDTQSIVIIDLG